MHPAQPTPRKQELLRDGLMEDGVPWTGDILLYPNYDVVASVGPSGVLREGVNVVEKETPKGG